MDVTWVMLEKNGTIYKYKLFDNEHLFNKDVMNLQIEGWNTDIAMDYNDIICIRTEDYLKTSIEDIPGSIKEFNIKRTKLENIPTFPQEIKNIQLMNSKIEMTDEKISELKDLYPKAKINITNFKFMESEWEKPRIQHRNNNDNLRLDHREQILPNTRNEPNNILDSSQTVHITSINHCVIESIKIIKKESKKYPTITSPEYLLFYNKNEKETIIGSILLFFKHYTINQFIDINFKLALLQWLKNDYEVHTVHKLNFKELFTMVMTIAENHPEKEDIKARIIMELKDSIGLCFTGRINRLVNALVGFVEGIKVSLSVREEIQLKISMIIKRLVDKKINVKTAKEEMEEIFKDVGENDNITEGFKEANIIALDDYLEYEPVGEAESKTEPRRETLESQTKEFDIIPTHLQNDNNIYREHDNIFG